jgi:hypothetical protein
MMNLPEELMFIVSSTMSLFISSMPGIVTSTMSLFISSMPDSHTIISSGSVAFSIVCTLGRTAGSGAVQCSTRGRCLRRRAEVGCQL